MVYRDRAEVTRTVEFTPGPTNVNSANEVTVVVSGITRHANLETVSVKPLVRNVFDILEVTHEDVVVPPVHISSPPSSNTGDEEGSVSTGSTAEQVAALRAQQEQIEDELAKLNRRRVRLDESASLTKSFAKTALLNTVKDKDTDNSASVSVSYAQSVLQFHSAELERLDEELYIVDKEIEAKEKDLKRVKAALAPKTSGSNSNSTNNGKGNNKSNKDKDLDNCKNVSVTFELLGHSADRDIPKVSFTLSYIVPNAHWSACYDVRVSTASPSTAGTQQQQGTLEDALTLSYFAEVTQVSGEDWTEVDLVLSTSNPAISSQPPSVKTKSVDFYQQYNYSTSNSRGGGYNSYKGKGGSDDGSVCSAASFALMEDGFPGQQQFFAGAAMQQQLMNEEYRQEGGPGARKANIEGTGDAGSTVFTLSRKSNIASDNKPHKVLVMGRRFKPQIVYYSVPSESPHVYIQAKVRNSSGYPLLTSNTVNIYVDGNFVSKSEMKAQANPGETFQLFLGVDPAVKIDYMPTKYEEYKRGWISGSEVKKVYHKTVVHNTKACVVRMIIADALPSPGADKITVELMEPAPSSIVENSSKAAFNSAQEAITNLTGLNGADNASDAGAGNDNASTTSVEPAWPADFVTKNKVTNNIIWFKTVKAGEKIEIPFSYRLSWPQGQNIYINEK